MRVDARRSPLTLDESALRAMVHGRAALGATRLVRGQMARAGVWLAVLRNPVSAGHARRHAAVGARGRARRIGCVLLSRRGPDGAGTEEAPP